LPPSPQSPVPSPRRLQPYKNLAGDSGITHYEIGPDYIAVKFAGGGEPYVYDYRTPGAIHVDQMKLLADAGRGLGTYISRNVGRHYARRGR
jgi:hypothetical protein